MLCFTDHTGAISKPENTFYELTLDSFCPRIYYKDFIKKTYFEV